MPKQANISHYFKVRTSNVPSNKTCCSAKSDGVKKAQHVVPGKTTEAAPDSVKKCVHNEPARKKRKVELIELEKGDELPTNTDTVSPAMSANAPPNERLVCSSTLMKLETFVANQNNVREKNDDVPDILEEGILRSHTVCESGKSLTSHLETYSRNRNVSPDSTSPKLGDSSTLTDDGTRLPGRNLKYTPLEQQIVAIKEKHPGTLLMVECGYKYRFFGTDAEIAAKELNIFCHLDHNFMTASIPTHRLFVHLRRLVAAGHKVAVVKQTETSALKAAGDTKSSLFSREVSAVYTKSTLLGEDVNPLSQGAYSDEESRDDLLPPANYLMCINECIIVGSKLHSISVVAVQPGTGDIVYDEFDDERSCSRLLAVISHIQPVEFLLPEALSADVENLVKGISAYTGDEHPRVERLPGAAFVPESSEQVDSFNAGRCDQLPDGVVKCLTAVAQYLKEFNLDTVLKLSCNMRHFSESTDHMKLNAQALCSLEIFQNSTDHRVQGSLLSVMDHTRTKFGSRLFKHWLSQPLCDIKKIEQRQDAVAEIIAGNCGVIVELAALLGKMPDVERGLCNIYYQRCSTLEFLSVAQSLQRVAAAAHADDAPRSPLLRDIVAQLPARLAGVGDHLAAIDAAAARRGDKLRVLRAADATPAVAATRGAIRDVETELVAHRREIRYILRMPAIDYVTVSGAEYLVEVRNSLLASVPADWTRVGATKAVTRFRSPTAARLHGRLCALREQLHVDCGAAWREFLARFGAEHGANRVAVRRLAELDCLLSLAETARQSGYARPLMVEHGPVLHFKAGRHPVVAAAMEAAGRAYVANDADLDAGGRRCVVVTGPNMGGKSSYVRQVALACIMAQVGSWVAARAAVVGVVDAVHVRMGARDAILRGQSTFMLELAETAEILASATCRSLVVLDELGRGTSTHDGAAIATATLRYVATELRCLTLFVTHYPHVAALETSLPHCIANYHMAFMLEGDTGNDDGNSDDGSDDDRGNDVDEGDGGGEDGCGGSDLSLSGWQQRARGGGNGRPAEVTFLYRLTAGAASRSYGLNVARLAGIPARVLRAAHARAARLEEKVECDRCERALFRRLCVDDAPPPLQLLREIQSRPVR
ncbi:PREDICTED: DNA mismatch repair protein Msh3-like [Priapulus caudatus]|uniref:DNA mismatch repair protein n=1 Tax=Priapulus caudatus TaxID=37621 RepID=A0ABM1EH85_PRICU|nr:PREDICTED: DNA mismatch repair protein Msh3-like [Priapulus caudatus]